MKELLDKLLNGEGKLSLLLLQTKKYAEDSNDENFLEFINNELNGYKDKELPDYRKVKAQIIGVIKDSYGTIVLQGEPVNFSVLSQKLGIDLNETHIPDSIGFIEDGLENVSSQLVQRQLHPEIVRMLNEVFKYNNPRYNLTSASHEFGRAAIQFILTKVRQEIIIGLQKIEANKSTILQEIKIVEALQNNKKVFVTYAWENSDHNDNVISFVNFLREKGYDASMDKKMSQEESAIDFNEMMLAGIQNSEKVIIILSKKYKEKADKFDGGVGFEYRIILEDLKKKTNKYIFVSFGKEKYDSIVPTGIGNRDILNLKKDQDENNFNNLFAKLNSETLINFSEVSESTVEVNKKEIKPFRL